MSTIEIVSFPKAARAPEPAQSWLAARLHAVGDALERAAARRARRRLRRRAARELSRLDDKTLADIGIPRGQIHEIANAQVGSETIWVAGPTRV